jgi:hypothetical protein
MKPKMIDLERSVQEIVEDVNQEADLLVLSDTLNREKIAGNRAFLVEKIIARAESLRSHGEGAEETPLFEMQDGTKPQDIAEHTHGEGAESVQNIPREQKMLGEMYRNEADKRMNNIDALAEVMEVRDNGAIVFAWGHVVPAQKEVVKDGKVVVKARPSPVVLKHCPKCGKTNRVDTAVLAECYHCGLQFMPVLKKIFEKFPERFKGMWFKF